MEGIEGVPDWLAGVDKDGEESGGESIPRSTAWNILEMNAFILLTVKINNVCSIGCNMYSENNRLHTNRCGVLLADHLLHSNWSHDQV